MKQKLLRSLVLGSTMLLTWSSCSQDDVGREPLPKSESSSAKPTTQMSAKQALAYVSLFGVSAEKAGKPESEARNVKSKEVGYIDYYVEGRDTLLYAVNYKDEEGFMLLSGDNSSFPILAHSDHGHLKFGEIPKESGLSRLIVSYKERVKKRIYDPNNLNSEYYENWKDLGNPDCEYKIELNNAPPVSGELRGRRRDSSGKASIYPFTGKDLDSWSQIGKFNASAKDGACIGCPAVAIGMLLYDCNNRIWGDRTSTIPDFSFSFVNYAKLARPDNDYAEMVSEKLRQIADSIPNYQWKSNDRNESGASPHDILEGLHKLGFKNAKVLNYDFETLYKNLTKTRETGFGTAKSERGVLLAGFGYGGAGHIWFCDGYYEQSWTVKKKFLFVKLKTWTEYDDCLYMNWGWGNGSNGWYRASEDGGWLTVEGDKFSGLEFFPMMFVDLDIVPNINEYEDPVL